MKGTQIETKAPHILRVMTNGLLSLSLVVLALASIAASPRTFPEIIPLPNGWQPEGIALGRGSAFFSGSLATGSIYKGDLRTGEGSILSQRTGRVAVGMKYDVRSNTLFVAGGPTGMAYVYDASSGASIAEYQLTTLPSFINDVVVTRNGAFFTNSSQPEIYEIPLSRNGRLPNPAQVRTIPLSGDYQQVAGFNANGIDATPDGKWLVIVHSALGVLYRVDPRTGEATQIDLGGGSVAAGDGILLRGANTLYVVQNQLNQIEVIKLRKKLTSGRIVDTLTNPNFDVPTTIARFGGALIRDQCSLHHAAHA